MVQCSAVTLTLWDGFVNLDDLGEIKRPWSTTSLLFPFHEFLQYHPSHDPGCPASLCFRGSFRSRSRAWANPLAHPSWVVSIIPRTKTSWSRHESRSMSQARSTLQVQGLDCPTEADALSAALLGAPGVLGLGFDLIHGTMTVDYEPSLTDPDRLIGLISSRTGMAASVLGAPIASDVAQRWS